jgi:DNA repair protein RadC
MSWMAFPPPDSPLASRERLRCLGAKPLSDEDLLALVLRGANAQERAQDILRDGLVGLLQLDERVWRLGKARAASLLAAVELGRRLARSRLRQRQLLNEPHLMAEYLYLRYHNPDQEVMGALYLDVRSRLLGEAELHRGTLSRVAVEPRVLLKTGLLHSASAMVMFHTHPSGSPAPSCEDLVFTRRAAAAGELVGIRLVDHIILGDAGCWVSLKNRGW